MPTERLRRTAGCVMLSLCLVGAVPAWAHAEPAQATVRDMAAVPYKTASFRAWKTGGMVHVVLDGAVFADGMDGSVAVLAPDGRTLDTLPATYRGRGISYRLLGSGELVAHPSMERGGITTYGMDGYAVCIARSALGGGVTGAVSGAITGGVPGASLGAVGGIIGGMVWGPFDCWGKTS
ncbi:hypothetical protein [Bifidobacterium moukalabense]|uniref:hypothetical protein n=1 Tax=Bifidobacterium moukalabense TaxID=1333651 RepID=UPI0010F5B23E|nr:hypothetical protein [Bifidobacterium moukalabense]